MIYSLFRAGVILIVAGLVAYFFSYVENIPGSIKFEFAEQEIKISLLLSSVLLIFFGFLFWLSLKFIGFFVAISDFLMGRETALLRFFKRIKYRSSQRALDRSIIALVGGEHETVLQEVKKAKFNPDLKKVISLIESKAHESLGNQQKADVIYKALLKKSDTRLVGIEGLIRSKISSGELPSALKLAERLVLYHPKNMKGLRTLFKLQCDQEDWIGARKTLIALQNLEKNTRDIRTRQEALILYADAHKKRSNGEIDNALEKIRESIRKGPSIVPVVSLASELELLVGKPKNAEKIIKTCWRYNPHPDLAKSFAAISPEETPTERLKRFKPLFSNLSENEVVMTIKIELLVANEDFPSARRILKKFIDDKPTSHLLILMAAVERGMGSEEEVVQGWVSKAFSAPRPATWFCSKCNQVGKWHPVCSGCGNFDSYEWGLPIANKIFSETDALLPLVTRKTESIQYSESRNFSSSNSDEALVQNDLNKKSSS